MTLKEELKALLRRARVYAPLREGGTKDQKELSVLNDLLESMTQSDQRIYFAPRVAPVDPPDCIAENAAGDLCAFEITEFVSSEAIAINERARPQPGMRPGLDQMVMATWTRETFLRRVEELLSAKDGKKYIGGPFGECVVVIHTDEPLLVRCDAEQWLASASFGPYKQLTGAYFLYSYEPAHGYPFQLIPFRPA